MTYVDAVLNSVYSGDLRVILDGSGKRSPLHSFLINAAFSPDQNATWFIQQTGILN